jgi:hypothetical protein
MLPRGACLVAVVDSAILNVGIGAAMATPGEGDVMRQRDAVAVGVAGKEAV